MQSGSIFRFSRDNQLTSSSMAKCGLFPCYFNTWSRWKFWSWFQVFNWHPAAVWVEIQYKVQGDKSQGMRPSLGWRKQINLSEREETLQVCTNQQFGETKCSGELNNINSPARPLKTTKGDEGRIFSLVKEKRLHYTEPSPDLWIMSGNYRRHQQSWDAFRNVNRRFTTRRKPPRTGKSESI